METNRSSEPQKRSPMVIIAITAVVIAIITVIILKYVLPDVNKDETITIYCGENKTIPVQVFRNPSQAFPTFAQEYTNKISASLSIADSLASSPKLKVSGNAALQNRIIELREKLNQDNIRMEMIMRSNFIGYNSQPCDNEIKRRYFDLLQTMAEKNNKLDILKANLTKPTDKGGTTRGNITIEKDTAKVNNAIKKFMSDYEFAKTL